MPEAIKKQGLLRVGVKCDYPPDGYLDAQGKPQGVEVSLAKQIAALDFRTLEMFAAIGCIYLGLVLSLSWAVRRAEWVLQRPFRTE